MVREQGEVTERMNEHYGMMIDGTIYNFDYLIGTTNSNLSRLPIRASRPQTP